MTQFSSPESAATSSPPKPASPPAIRVATFGEGLTWVSDGFKLYTSSLPMWIVVMVLFYFLNLAMAMVPFAGQLLTPMLMAGMMLACRGIERGEGMRFDHFMAGCTERPIPLLILGVVYLAATIAIVIIVAIIGFATAGATVIMSPAITSPETAIETLGLSAVLSLLLILLVVLLLTLPLAMAYWFAVQLVQFDDVPPLEALKLSFAACLKNLWPFLLYGIVMLVLFCLVFVPFGLGMRYWLAAVLAMVAILFVGVPVTIATMYTSYKGVFGK